MHPSNFLCDFWTIQVPPQAIVKEDQLVAVRSAFSEGSLNPIFDDFEALLARVYLICLYSIVFEQILDYKYVHWLIINNQNQGLVCFSIALIDLRIVILFIFSLLIAIVMLSNNLNFLMSFVARH